MANCLRELIDAVKTLEHLGKSRHRRVGGKRRPRTSKAGRKRNAPWAEHYFTAFHISDLNWKRLGFECVYEIVACVELPALRHAPPPAAIRTDYFDGTLGAGRGDLRQARRRAYKRIRDRAGKFARVDDAVRP